MKPVATIAALVLAALTGTAAAQLAPPPLPPPAPAEPAAQPTLVRSPAARAALLGRRPFQLHWISWNEFRHFGRLDIADRGGTIVMRGRHEKDGDFIEIDGRIVELDNLVFLFEGRIVTRVKTISGGRPCLREGRYTFRKTGGRAFYRMQEMQNPCEGGNLVDYIDVFPGR